MRPSISVTLLVIANSLFPRRRGGRFGEVPLTVSHGVTAVPREAIPDCLAALHRAVGTDGKLALFFTGCGAAAAPFLLFRLKREGYSDCRATYTGTGLRLDASR